MNTQKALISQFQAALEVLPVESLESEGPRKRLNLLTVGFRQPDGLGGPPAYAKGRAPRSRDEVALDKAAAHRLGIGVGDAIAFIGRRVVVTGLTTGTNILASQFLFADLDLAAEGSNAVGRASFVLVQLAPGADRERVVRAIEPGRIPHAAAVWGSSVRPPPLAAR